MAETTTQSSDTESFSIFIVEDHDNLRKVLGVFLDMQDDMYFCGSASSAEEALPQLTEVKPDVLMVDLSLPGMNGIDLVRRVRAELPETKCVILSGHNQRSYASQAIEAGAVGYLIKGDPVQVGKDLRRCAHGETVVAQQL
ncbi:MAG: LuxR family two component transcriptional regulator [Puniceicoccaceae bacterium 5H]|nr:MAG: LuxR family two component transcriptional regulator [Puniceicoccaceae bacterium 5H]